MISSDILALAVLPAVVAVVWWRSVLRILLFAAVLLLIVGIVGVAPFLVAGSA